MARGINTPIPAFVSLKFVYPLHFEKTHDSGYITSRLILELLVCGSVGLGAVLVEGLGEFARDL